MQLLQKVYEPHTYSIDTSGVTNVRSHQKKGQTILAVQCTGMFNTRHHSKYLSLQKFLDPIKIFFNLN